MMKLYELTGNFGLVTISVSLCVTLVLLPFMAKSKKSMMRMTRLALRVEELRASMRATSRSSMRRWPASTVRRRQTPCQAASGALPFPILLALYRAGCEAPDDHDGIDAATIAGGSIGTSWPSWATLCPTRLPRIPSMKRYSRQSL